MSHDAQTPSKPVVEWVVLGGVVALAAGVFISRGPEQPVTEATAEIVSEQSPTPDTREQQTDTEQTPTPAPNPEQPIAAASTAPEQPTPTRAEPPAVSDPSPTQPEDKSCTAPCRPPRRCIRGYCKLPEESTAPDRSAAAEPGASVGEGASALAASSKQGKCAKGETECGGRCANLQSDAQNCGDCGLVCTLLHQMGTPSCRGGRCVGGACQSGWANCDDLPGCETNITTAEHCGSCFTHCRWYEIKGRRVRGKCVNGACAAPTGE